MRETDSQLVQRTLRGDNRAFDELVERYRNRVFQTARRLLHGDESADIAQDAFVRAYMSLRALNDAERFAPWLMTIVGNLCKMHLRRQREITVSVDVIDNTRSTTDAAPQDLEALDHLPKGTRTAAMLFFVDELKQSEIAERLGISLSAVKARIRHARIRLQKEMIDVEPKRRSDDGISSDLTKSLKRKLELARWYTEVAEHIEQGWSIMRSLNAVCETDHPDYVKECTRRIMHAIYHSESTLTDALAAEPLLAGPQASGMIHASEQVGGLQIGARYIANWLDAQAAEQATELVFWCRTFGYLLTAAASPTEILNFTRGIARSKALEQATREIVGALDAPAASTDASRLRPILDRYPDVLPPLARVAILAGESTGMLNQTLTWVADEMADDLAVKIARGAEPVQRSLSPRRLKLPERDSFREPFQSLLSDPAPDIRAAAADALRRLG